MAFQKYSNMEQSLFTRVVRLGVPTVDLDAQGRARPSLCSLYQWRYKKLGNLEHVISGPEHRVANAGFVYDFQLINVEDFQGIGESEPNPYFFQNLAEAEYVVAVFMYMRLLGYPAEKISILTTYNGQKHLIRDVVNTRCANNPLIGRPSKIDTVDKYQVWDILFSHPSIFFSFIFDKQSFLLQTHTCLFFSLSVRSTRVDFRVNKTITFSCHL
jgi:intron-binding protein aquarius